MQQAEDKNLEPRTSSLEPGSNLEPDVKPRTSNLEPGPNLGPDIKGHSCVLRTWLSGSGQPA